MYQTNDGTVGLVSHLVFTYAVIADFGLTTTYCKGGNEGVCANRLPCHQIKRPVSYHNGYHCCTVTKLISIIKRIYLKQQLSVHNWEHGSQGQSMRYTPRVSIGSWNRTLFKILKLWQISGNWAVMQSESKHKLYPWACISRQINCWIKHAMTHTNDYSKVSHWEWNFNEYSG